MVRPWSQPFSSATTEGGDGDPPPLAWVVQMRAPASTDRATHSAVRKRPCRRCWGTELALPGDVEPRAHGAPDVARRVLWRRVEAVVAGLQRPAAGPAGEAEVICTGAVRVPE